MLDIVWIILGLTMLLFWWASLLALGRGMRRMTILRQAPAWPSDEVQPHVTVVVPARNEERHIKAALETLLNQSYNNLEVLVLNDRSTDGTARILSELAGRYERLRVVHVRRLPGGWLGKNHALWLGARKATGDWILFTDADVMMERSVVSRAMAHARSRRLDHLTIGPELMGGSFGLKVVVSVFMVFFALALRPWRASDSRSRAFIGIGAFNLVKREAYWASGGHQRIRLRPDDDVRLGQILKRHGARQEMISGVGALRVEWYQTLGEFVRGLEKNMFAGFQYSVPLVILATAIMLLMGIGPFVVLLAASGIGWWLNLAAVTALLIILAGKMITQRENPGAVLVFPIGVVILVFVIWRSTALALWRGGIRWRGTFYSLRKLRRNKV